MNDDWSNVLINAKDIKSFNVADKHNAYNRTRNIICDMFKVYNVQYYDEKNNSKSLYFFGKIELLNKNFVFSVLNDEVRDAIMFRNLIAIEINKYFNKNDIVIL
jgi:hypothetical protein